MLETFFSGPGNNDLNEYDESHGGQDLYDSADSDLDDTDLDDLDYEDDDDMDDMEEIEDLDELDDLTIEGEDGEFFEEEDFGDEEDAVETRKDIWSNMEWDKD